MTDNILLSQCPRASGVLRLLIWGAVLAAVTPALAQHPGGDDCVPTQPPTVWFPPPPQSGEAVAPKADTRATPAQPGAAQLRAQRLRQLRQQIDELNQLIHDRNKAAAAADVAAPDSVPQPTQVSTKDPQAVSRTPPLIILNPHPEEVTEPAEVLSPVVPDPESTHIAPADPAAEPAPLPEPAADEHSPFPDRVPGKTGSTTPSRLAPPWLEAPMNVGAADSGAADAPEVSPAAPQTVPGQIPDPALHTPNVYSAHSDDLPAGYDPLLMPAELLSNPVDRLGLANSLYAAGAFPLARTTYEQLLQDADPRLDRLWIEFQIAACARKMGDRDAANRILRRVAGDTMGGWQGDYGRWWLKEIEERKQLEDQLSTLKDTIRQLKEELDGAAK